MAQAIDVTQAYSDQFARLRPDLPGEGDPRLATLRADALSRFAAAGIPTPRLEDWKYTRFSALLDAPFAPAPAVADGIDGAAEDSSDDEALDYSDDPILEQSYRTLRAVNDAIHNRP